jgi:DNA (cytosine-5)-methyltransferase 1
MEKMKVLDLFSGIGGFSLGLERTGGFETVAFCEIEDFPRRVLAKHWPKLPCYRDVKQLTAQQLSDDGVVVDMICGGFPCQDLSVAGRQEGIDGDTRSSLWSEMLRLVCELRPQIVIVENVANLLRGPASSPGRWFGKILSDLAECGYDAEWENIPAGAMGLPHFRERVWVLAYANQVRSEGRGVFKGLIDAAQPKFLESPIQISEAHYHGLLSDVWGGDAGGILRGSYGISNRLDRISACGNAVVPQIPELIGRAILASQFSPLPAEKGA